MIDWTSWLDYGFMRNALLAVLIITPLFALLGTMIVNKKTPSSHRRRAIFTRGTTSFRPIIWAFYGIRKCLSL